MGLRWIMGVVLCTVPLTVQAQERQRPFSYGIEVGWAIEQEMFGSGEPSGVQMGIVRLQLIPSVISRPGRRFESLQIVTELSLIETLRPGKRFILGPNVVFRPNIRLDDRYVLFADAGLGISSSSMRHESIAQVNGRMQYQLRVGMGIRRCIADDQSILIAANVLHFSNNGTTEPNPGLNLYVFAIGYTF